MADFTSSVPLVAHRTPGRFTLVIMLASLGACDDGNPSTGSQAADAGDASPSGGAFGVPTPVGPGQPSSGAEVRPAPLGDSGAAGEGGGDAAGAGGGSEASGGAGPLGTPGGAGAPGAAASPQTPIAGAAGADLGASGADPTGTAGAASSGGAGAGGSNAGLGGSSDGDGGTSDGGSSDGGSGEPVGGAGGTPSVPGADDFGIEELYPSAPSGAAWDSAHWSSSGAYSISERRDGNDPSGLSGMRGEGELEVEDGELVMSGSQPRIYVYPNEGAEWLNVEVTVYYQRVADQDTSYAGLVIGVRSGPDGHTSDTPCDAHTYYSRLRNDGDADFEKELEHSPSSTRASTSLQDFLPPDGEASEGTWIGWKYISYNLPGEAAVKFEAYIDLTGGEGGGDWQLVNETIDEGGWFTDTTCEQYSPVDGESDFVWLDGGTVFIRNTDVEEARYRWFSIREIVPP